MTFSRLAFLGCTLFALVFLFGCGKAEDLFGANGNGSRTGNSGNLGELKDTYWVTVTSSQFAFVVHFKSDGRYVGGTVRSAGAGMGYAMANRGKYIVDGDEIKLEPEMTSCPDKADKSTKTWVYTKDGSITATHQSTTLTLRKYDGPKSLTEGIITWGCFRGDGSFYEHAWTNL